MFTINDDNSIYATRGDIVVFSVTADEAGVAHKFNAGDVVRIKVYGKKNAENVVLQKDFPVTELTESVDIILTEEDTKFGDVISKPTDYWYEVELNPFTYPQTIIGYDEDGAKVFRLYPEGADIPESVVEPEDIPVVDEELDMTSTRPVENQAIARAITRLQAMIYPVGSVYISVNATSPADLFGGVWQRLKDRFLLGAGDIYNAGSTGGSSIHVLTEDELPAHTHQFTTQLYQTGNLSPEGVMPISALDYETAGFEPLTPDFVGGGMAHNNMPPYLTVYMWVRTA